MKRQQIEYSILQDFDIIFTGDKRIFSFGSIIRLFSMGRGFIKYRKCTPVHCGILLNLEGQILIAEMLGQQGGIRLRTPEHYLKNKKGSFVVGIRRFFSFLRPTDEDRVKAKARIMQDVRRGLEYDYKGLLTFASKKAKDNDRTFYCSEYVAEIYKSEFSVSLPVKWEHSVSPLDIYRWNRLKRVDCLIN